MAQNIVYKDRKMMFDLLYKDKGYNLSTNVFGTHNVYNILGVIGCLLTYQFSIDQIIKAIELLKSIPGRNEIIQVSKEGWPRVVLDYAHTPDALKNVLQSLRAISDNEIILLFGCGGNRDKGKRRKMALVANEYADKVIVTTDNPRYEDPLEIIKDITKNITTSHVVIESREQAIKKAIGMMEENSILLIAGKGHEQHQEIKGIKHPFSDKDIALLELGGIT